jgi:hypothetical protein
MITKGLIMVAALALSAGLWLVNLESGNLRRDMDQLQDRMDKLNRRCNTLTEAYRSVVGVVGDIDDWMEEQKREQLRLKSRKERCGDDKEKGGGYNSGKAGKQQIPQKNPNSPGGSLRPPPTHNPAEGGPPAE